MSPDLGKFIRNAGATAFLIVENVLAPTPTQASTCRGELLTPESPVTFPDPRAMGEGGNWHITQEGNEVVVYQNRAQAGTVTAGVREYKRLEVPTKPNKYSSFIHIGTDQALWARGVWNTINSRIAVEVCDNELRVTHVNSGAADPRTMIH